MPKGNPTVSQDWTDLSWRELLRHVYRHERGWGDIAQDQPRPMQHACLMLFLGAAEFLYSDDHTALVELRRDLANAQRERDYFTSILNQLYQHMVADERMSVAPTSDSMAEIIDNDRRLIGLLRRQRQQVQDGLVSDAARTGNLPHLESLTRRWELLQAERQDLRNQQARSEDRVRELVTHRSGLDAELQRLSRVRGAGRVFADLKVTHCPACDQPVTQTNAEEGFCFLCKEPQERDADSRRRAEERIEFEVHRLNSELGEIDELVASIHDSLNAARQRLAALDADLEEVEANLRPLRQAVAVILPPELEQLDLEIGRLGERVQQWERFASLLRQRDALADRVDEASSRVAQLESEIAERRQELRLDAMALAISEGMNTYLNALNHGGVRRWPLDPVTVQLNQRSSKFKVGGEPWKVKVGGTTSLFFMMAYHYALLRLTGKANFRYPGLVIVDVPPDLNRETVRDQENFALEPFVSLVNLVDTPDVQVIAAGAAFEGLEGAHRIELIKVWEDHERPVQMGLGSALLAQ